MASGRILITGATGFIGRHLVSHFLFTGRELTLAVRRADACPPEWRKSGALKIVVIDQAGSWFREAVSDASVIIHLAGLAHQRSSAVSEECMMAVNATMTQKLVKAAADSGVQTFVHMSSLAAITASAASAVIDDVSHAAALTPYGRAKREAEKHVLELADLGIGAVSLRPPLVVGAQAKGNWQALQRLAASGIPLPFAGIDNRRSLIGIGSLVAVVERLCAADWAIEKSGCYCIVDEETVSLPAIVSALRQGMGMNARLFRFPPGLLRGLMRAVNRQNLAASLLGNLVVDASRFRQTFNFQQPGSLICAITESGMLYRRISANGFKASGNEAAD